MSATLIFYLYQRIHKLINSKKLDQPLISEDMLYEIIPFQTNIAIKMCSKKWNKYYNKIHSPTIIDKKFTAIKKKYNIISTKIMYNTHKCIYKINISKYEYTVCIKRMVYKNMIYFKNYKYLHTIHTYNHDEESKPYKNICVHITDSKNYTHLYTTHFTNYLGSELSMLYDNNYYATVHDPNIRMILYYIKYKNIFSRYMTKCFCDMLLNNYKI
jgi:hypothetical protein